MFFTFLILWFNLKFQLYIKNLNLSLLKKFISISYENYLKYHKTELINNVVNEINYISNSAKHLLVLISETLVIIGIIIFFFVYRYSNHSNFLVNGFIYKSIWILL